MVETLQEKQMNSDYPKSAENHSSEICISWNLSEISGQYIRRKFPTIICVGIRSEIGRIFYNRIPTTNLGQKRLLTVFPTDENNIKYIISI